MQFTLDKSTIGTEKHLSCDDNKLMWVDEVQPPSWHVTNGNVIGKNFNDLVNISLKELDFLPPKKYVDMMKTFSNVNLSCVPWQRVMTKRDHAAFVKALLNKIECFLCNAPTNYYDGTWVKASAVFNNLQRAKINKRLLKELFDKNKGNISALQTFVPRDDGFANEVVYNRFATETGRLTVKSGPHILELKREHRSIIESIHGDDGEICIIDFNALEPRVVLYEANKSCENKDIYSHVANEHKLTRTEAKAGTICTMYGAGTNLIVETLQCDEARADEISNAIRKYYEIRALTNRIKTQFIKEGTLQTRFGRPLKIDDPRSSVLLNHFVQGTGCDVVLLAFSNITEEMKTKTPNCRPLFMIHDALVIDALKSELPKLDELLTVKVSSYVQRFYLKRTKIY